MANRAGPPVSPRYTWPVTEPFGGATDGGSFVFTGGVATGVALCASIIAELITKYPSTPNTNRRINPSRKPSIYSESVPQTRGLPRKLWARNNFRQKIRMDDPAGRMPLSVDYSICVYFPDICFM
jgi:hypothetical protein